MDCRKWGSCRANCLFLVHPPAFENKDGVGILLLIIVMYTSPVKETYCLQQGLITGLLHASMRGKNVTRPVWLGVCTGLRLAHKTGQIQCVE